MYIHARYLYIAFLSCLNWKLHSVVTEQSSTVQCNSSSKSKMETPPMPCSTFSRHMHIHEQCDLDGPYTDCSDEHFLRHMFFWWRESSPSPLLSPSILSSGQFSTYNTNWIRMWQHASRKHNPLAKAQFQSSRSVLAEGHNIVLSICLYVFKLNNQFLFKQPV